jgi:protein SCO1/2
LRSAATAGGVAGATVTAGCLGVFGDSGPEDMVLDAPERDLSEAVYPSYGEEMPEFTVPDPIAGEEISISELKEDRAMLWTSFYTSCPDGVCPALILRLRRAHEVATEQGYDGGEFLALTFDPERDTEETLREYATEQGVDVAADNWHFLRPGSYEAAQGILKDNFGLVIEKQPAEQYDNLEYRFPHVGLILLVNKRGIVERAYPDPNVEVERVTADFVQVVTA